MESVPQHLKIALTATPCQPRFAPILLKGDVAVAFRTAAELDCQGVELHLRRAEDVRAEDVKRLMSEYGLGVPTLGTGMAAGEDGLTFSDPDPEVRARAVARVSAHVNLAADTGSAVTVGSVSGKLGVCQGDPRRVRRLQALECLGQVCQAALRCGVTVLLEPLNRYECDYVNTLADALAVADEIAVDNLKFLADTFHMNIEEADLEASLAAAGARLGHVHLADTNRRAPGHGHLDVARILGALGRLGYQGWLSLEILPLPDPFRAIMDSVGKIRAAWGARSVAAGPSA